MKVMIKNHLIESDYFYDHLLKLADGFIDLLLILRKSLISKINEKDNLGYEKEREIFFFKLFLETVNDLLSVFTLIKKRCFSQSMALLRAAVKDVASAVLISRNPKLKDSFIDSKIKLIEFFNASKEAKIKIKGNSKKTDTAYLSDIENEWAKEIIKEDKKRISDDDLISAANFNSLVGFRKFFNAIIHKNINIYCYEPIQTDIQFPFDVMYISGSTFYEFIYSLNKICFELLSEEFLNKGVIIQGIFEKFIRIYGFLALNFVVKYPNE